MEYYTFISQIEAGRGRIPAERMRDWSIALEMDPREFTNYINEVLRSIYIRDGF